MSDALTARGVAFATIALVLTGCASSQFYVNDQAIYQRAWAQGPQLWYGEIVPDCMKARGWRLE